MNEETSQLTLSYELLHLIQWLVENEPDELKKMIISALNSGLKNEFKKSNSSEQSTLDDNMHYSIVDFLGLLEALLHETIDEQRTKQVLEKKLMPALDQIDSTECDTDMVQTSLENASSQFEKNPGNNAQELLFKELLKSWDPAKKIAN